MLIVNPVIAEPLTREWEDCKANIEEKLKEAQTARQRTPETQAKARTTHAVARRQEEAAERDARGLYERYLERLRDFRVLDPACGSGNFLYLALLALKDLERRAHLEMEALSADYDMQVGMYHPEVGPQCLKGIEINRYAAELARVSVWVGEIQWMQRNGLNASKNPILKSLGTIECRNALLNGDGTEAEWPQADVVIGNPPFLGAKRQASSIDSDELSRLRAIYGERVLGLADYVTYWFVKSAEGLRGGRFSRAGLVGTNSIRDGASQKNSGRCLRGNQDLQRL